MFKISKPNNVMVFWVCAASTHRALLLGMCATISLGQRVLCVLANKPFAASKQHVTINLVSAAVVGL